MKHASFIPTFLLLVAVSASSIVIFAQTPTTSIDQYAVAVLWSEFNIPSKKLSFAFPKMPVVRNSSNPCSQIETGLHHAYAGETVYEFEWHAKSNEPMPEWCSVKTKFSKSAYTDRIKELKAQSRGYVESTDSVAGLEAVVLRSAGAVVRTRWLIWNKDRWLELGVTHRKETVVDEGRFIGGLKLTSSTGMDVGSGAMSTLGDPNADVSNDSKATAQQSLVILAKPRPGYTEAARQSTLQGTVILRVTFLRNGGIGAVSVVKSLPLGLTEQAVSAAKKISFLPGISDGKLISTTKQVEYSFSIY